MMAHAFGRSIGLIAAGFLAFCGEHQALATDPEAVGTFTTVQGKVLMTHSGAPAAVSVKQNDGVFVRAVIETQPASRTKALFIDDTLLTVGENSRVEITEQIYDPNRDLRSVVAKLVTGKVRALVGRVFEGAGSKFEIHTSTAVAAARGTYFVVWVDEEEPARVGQNQEVAVVLPVSSRREVLAKTEGATSGAVNIGQTGNVTFTSGGQSVDLLPGQFSIALPNQAPLSPGFLVPGTPGIQGALAAVHDTEVKEAAKLGSPRKVLNITGGNAPTGGILAGPGSPPVPITPPAVVSGAAETTNHVNLTIILP